MQGVKRFGAYLVLALSMLLMQQGGFRHALQHGVKDTDGAPGHSSLCKDCLSFCANDDLVTPQIATLALATATHTLQAIRSYALRDATFTASYQSRAPPFQSFWF